MNRLFALLFAAFLLLPRAGEAAPPFPPTAKRPISLPEKSPLPVDATVAGLPVTVRGDTVIVNAGNNDNLSPINLQKNALAPFTALLKAYPHTRSFTLSWYEPFMMDADSADVLYDRIRHTVTVNYSYGGGIDPQVTGKVVFTGVRESVFAAMLEARPHGVPQNDPETEKITANLTNHAGTWGGFQYLYQPRYGCRVSVPFARRHRHSQHTRHKEG